jgi:hypothetical protein
MSFILIHLNSFLASNNAPHPLSGCQPQFNGVNSLQWSTTPSSPISHPRDRDLRQEKEGKWRWVDQPAYAIRDQKNKSPNSDSEHGAHLLHTGQGGASLPFWCWIHHGRHRILITHKSQEMRTASYSTEHGPKSKEQKTKQQMSVVTVVRPQTMLLTG